MPLLTSMWQEAGKLLKYSEVKCEPHFKKNIISRTIPGLLLSLELKHLL